MRYLVVLAWPAGLALIGALGAMLARRAPAEPAPGARWRRGWPAPDAGRGPRWLRGSAGEAVRIGALVAGGALLVYLLMAAIGTAVVHGGPVIDKPALHWIVAHRVAGWARVLDRLTKIGDTWTTWGAAAAAAVCLAVTARARRWLPPFLLAGAIVVDHYTTLAIRHTFHRIGPPGSPGGTYPSGGVDRVELLYGLIAFLLWQAFSGRRRTAIAAAAAVAGLAFNEAYSRAYLTLHWLTDIGSGLLYGALMLTVFIAATRLVAGRAGPPAAAGPEQAASGRARPAPSRQAPA